MVSASALISLTMVTPTNVVSPAQRTPTLLTSKMSNISWTIIGASLTIFLLESQVGSMSVVAMARLCMLSSIMESIQVELSSETPLLVLSRLSLLMIWLIIALFLWWLSCSVDQLCQMITVLVLLQLICSTWWTIICLNTFNETIIEEDIVLIRWIKNN